MNIIQYRATQGGELTADMENRNISGYGIVFNSDSHPMHIWDNQRGIVEVVEQITPESMRDADMSDIISAFNHDFDKVLGRTTSGTMKINRDAKGIMYRVDAPKTTYANNVLELLDRGDLSGSSFVFTMDFEEGFDIQEREDGTLIASPVKITKIFEMGPVVKPAYPETTAENRSHFDALEAAVKRFLDAKNAETREEQTEEAETTAETPEPETQKREEQTITYPCIARYTFTARALKAKNN